MKPLFAGATLAVLIATMPALAQDAPPSGIGGPGGAGGPPRALTKADMQAMAARRFERLDTNHDGVVSKDEMPAPPPGGPGGMGGPGGGGRGMRGMGMGPGWFDRVDADHDGKVTKAEADAASATMFDRLDANHDGTVTRDEMMSPG